jgi:hypothetical protein
MWMRPGSRSKPQASCEPMVIGSLFSGAGLLDAGLHQAGHEHAWFVERDEFRRGLLARRWPGRPVHDDVRTVGAHNLEPVECIAGGFPCRGTSTAGLRNGLDHPETALWAEFARIVREIGPRYVVVENVGNVLAVHDGGVWGVVLRDLAEAGYDVAWGCFRASDFGAPHQRDRVVALAAHAERVGWREGGPEIRQGRSEVERSGADQVGEGPAIIEGGWPEQSAGARAGTGSGCGVPVEWGDYEPAIRRWEAIHGPAPEPLVRRLDDGDAKLRRMRARVDRSRLSTLGDGVHVYLGRLIGDALHELERGGGVKLLPTPSAVAYGNNQSPSEGAAVRPSLENLMRGMA